MNTIHADLLRQLKREWPEILSKAQEEGLRKRWGNLQLPQRPRLLTLPEGQAKLKKAQQLGVMSAGLTLSPHRESGPNLCKWATSCPSVCLKETGQLRMEPAQRARLWRTALLIGKPIIFNVLFALEVLDFAERARKLGVQATMRFNLLSDLPHLAEAFAAWADWRGLNDVLSWYDYTKSLKWASRGEHRRGRPWRTYSYSSAPGEGASWSECEQLLSEGGSVAVVTSFSKDEQLPSTWRGYPAIDGDEHDLRNPGEAGQVVLLRFKGGSKLAARPAARRLRVV